MSENDLTESEILLYSDVRGAVKVDVLYRDESFWLTQKRMAELFAVQRPAITKHLKKIFETNELSEDSVCSILETTDHDGNNRSRLLPLSPTIRNFLIVRPGFSASSSELLNYGR